MSVSQTMRRIVYMSVSGRAVSLFAILGLTVLIAQPAMAGEFYSEVHPTDLSVASPEWNSVYEYSFDLPMFNTLGGTRTLIGYDVDFGMGSVYTREVHANPTANVVGCETSWPMTWTSELNGEQWFPQDQTGGYFDLTMGFGTIRGPFNEGEPPVQDGGLALGLTRSFGDPSLLAQLTGVGTVSIDCTHTLGSLTAAEPHRWPGVPGVFVPDLIDITMNELVANVTVTYYYTPEPGTLALLGMGIVSFIRRR